MIVTVNAFMIHRFHASYGRPVTEHLPGEIHRLEPTESCCPECNGELDFPGEVSSEQLELLTSALKVIRTVRVKKPVHNVAASLKRQPLPIDRGIAGPGLMARE